MVENDGLLVVERYAPQREPSSGYSSAEVLGRYRGFDGTAWPGDLIRDVDLTNGLAAPGDVDRLAQYVTKIGRPEIDLVYCVSAKPPDSRYFQFVGYDVGYYVSEYMHYSAVLNELLYGTSPAMVEHAKFLNAHLLFETEARALDFLRTRADVLRSHADVERGGEPLYAQPMFALRRP